MKKVMTFLLAAVLLIGAAPATQAQKSKVLTSKEAEEILQRIVGKWQVSHYVTEYDFEKSKLVETKGTASFGKAFKGNYVHEQFELEQPDGSTLQGDGFIRYSEEQNQFELVQFDKKGKSIVQMVGKWYPGYNTLLFTHVKGEGQWSKKNDPNMHCLYLFKEDGTFLRVNRTFDKNGNCLVISQDHYSYPDVADLR